MKIIVFDLDGTLALDDHRVHHLRKLPKDWDAYFSAASGDIPHEGLRFVYEALLGNFGYSIQIWTGRVESIRQATEEWIDKHLLMQPDALRMRPKEAGLPEEHRILDSEMKRQWLNEERAKGNEVILVFEDRKRVVEMWRSEGVTCAQVAPGEF